MDSLSNTFHALADPTRRAMLARLSRQELTLSELAQPLQMTLPAVAKHLKVLEHAGLVHRRPAARSRPARLDPRALRKAVDWVERNLAFWNASFDRLDALLASETSIDDPPARRR